MRHTKLSCEELIKQFSNPELGQHWKFFHLYEIGNILSEGGEEAKQAEAFFRDLLDSKNPDEALVALRHLLALDYIEEKTWEKLKKFPEESYDNKRIYRQASEPVSMIRAEGI